MIIEKLLEVDALLSDPTTDYGLNSRILTTLFDGLEINYIHRTYEQIYETMAWGKAIISDDTDSALWLCANVLPNWTLANVRFNQNDDKTWHCELRKGHLTAYSSVIIAGNFSKYNSGLKTPAKAICLAIVRVIMQEAKP